MEIISPISLGELVDKISILEIKIKKINDTSKQKNIINELNKLENILSNLNLHDEIIIKYKKKLYQINQELWEVEDILREKENKNEFGDDFINFARKVYKLNDKRFEFKNELNKAFDSQIVEEKSYKSY